MISAAKLRGLREILEHDGIVTFKNGSVVERIVDEVITDQTGKGEQIVHFVVSRISGGVARFAGSEIDRAYAMALDGPTPKPQPSGDATRFGDDPPF